MWNPEFLREGFAVEGHAAPRPPRLRRRRTGEARRSARKAALDEVYATPLSEGIPLIVTDYATAQLVKVAANSFLATKISFINAMAELCEATGADVTSLADAIGYDARIGRRFLNAGLGFGGGCLPKDIRAFMARAGELGVDQALSFLREVDSINMRRRVRTVDLAREVCDGSIVGRRVAVLGASFKPDSDDVRDSPALSVAAQMQLQGARVVVTDPQAIDNARAKWPDLALRATPPRRRRPAPTSCCWRPSGRSTATSTRRSSARSCAPATSSTAATCSTRPRGARRAGPTGRSAGPDGRPGTPPGVPGKPAPLGGRRGAARGCGPGGA